MREDVNAWIHSLPHMHFRVLQQRLPSQACDSSWATGIFPHELSHKSTQHPPPKKQGKDSVSQIYLKYHRLKSTQS